MIFPTTIMTEKITIDERGYYGEFGGAYVPEMLHANVRELQDCYLCHGQGFCNNGICHNLSHPPDMLYSHAEEYRQQGEQVCYICHQDIHCSQCHPGGAVDNP